jgi:hypothetical protein
MNASTLSIAENFLARKYDPSAHLDRSHGTGVFPEPYVRSLCARTVMVSKGAGLEELYFHAKQALYYKPGFKALKSSGLYLLRSFPMCAAIG